MNKYPFKVQCTQTVTFEYTINLCPEGFLHCADEVELFEEIQDLLYDRMPFCDKFSRDYSDELQYFETTNVGTWFDLNSDFLKEWKKLKNQLEKEKE